MVFNYGKDWIVSEFSQIIDDRILRTFLCTWDLIIINWFSDRDILVYDYISLELYWIVFLIVYKLFAPINVTSILWSIIFFHFIVTSLSFWEKEYYDLRILWSRKRILWSILFFHFIFTSLSFWEKAGYKNNKRLTQLSWLYFEIIQKWSRIGGLDSVPLRVSHYADDFKVILLMGDEKGVISLLIIKVNTWNIRGSLIFIGSHYYS